MPSSPTPWVLATWLVATGGCDDGLWPNRVHTDGATPDPNADTAPPVTEAPDPLDTADPDLRVPSDLTLVDDRAWVTRMSLDLRGVRPTPDELAQVDADPGAALTLMETYLADPRFGERMAWLFNDRLHTATWYQSSPFRYFPDMTEAQGRAAGWAPLELVRTIADNDLPWSTVVTADTLPENDLTAAFWGHPLPGSGDAWTSTPAHDGRPMAGVLSSSTLWLVYDADRNNFNRRRANVVAQVFLCADLFERDVTFTFDLDPTELRELEDAIRTVPACTGCHAVLDPLASFMGGFVERSAAEPTHQLAQYSPWTEDWYRTWNPPAYFGHPGHDLTDLGAFLAQDPRLGRCAAEQFAEGLIGAPVTDEAWIGRWAAGFRENGMVLRHLARAIVRSPPYRAAGERVLTTEQLASSVADLVGWQPQDTEDLSELAWKAELRLLGGGTDDAVTLTRNRSPGVGHLLAMTWGARRVADQALEDDLDRPAEDRVLLTHVDGREPPADSELRDQLAHWHAHFLSQSVEGDSAEIDLLVDLFTASGGADDPLSGYATVVEALLRHPYLLVY